ncbi:hypothetical protein HDV05_002353, partial [Chytridiales sp. JEL 0842]
MTMLFMKIDANSDGTVDWDEFSTYMMTGSMGSEIPTGVIDEKIRRLINGPHKDMIKRIDFIPKEKKYITVRQKYLSANYDEDGDLILFGDDGGYVNVLHVTRKFLFDSAADSEASEQLTPAKLLKRDSMKKNSLSFYR